MFADNLSKHDVAFEIIDVDNLYTYKHFFNTLAEELAEFMDREIVPFREVDDHTGTYLIGEFQSRSEAINFMDLFNDALANPDVEIDLDSINVYTEDNIVYQRFANIKNQLLLNVVSGLFEDYNSLDNRHLLIEQAIEYNGLNKMRDVVRIIGLALEKQEIHVAEEINKVFIQTFH